MLYVSCDDPGLVLIRHSSGTYGEHDHKEEAGWPVVATDADYKHELDSLTRNNSSFNILVKLFSHSNYNRQ